MSSHQWKQDVFVSLKARIDEDKEDTGETINDKLLKAIRHARFVLIVFSTNYADSESCLNKLVEILESRRQLKNHGHVAVSIFMV
ncbi:hypothetical protein NL676_015866 [Syzygium grande]|nr:hypothetical protein NL676_015866 [Syzygium grande]